MLNLLRQGGVIKALMGAVVLLIMAAFAIGSGGSGGTLSNRVCVVEVDDGCVEPKEYHSLLRLVAPSGATDKELKKQGFAGHAVNALIERELLLREARKLGVAVTEDDLDAELAIGRVHYSWPADAPLPAAVAQGLPYPLTGAADLVTYIRVRNSKTGVFDYDIYKRQIQNLLRMSPREFKDLQETELIASRVRGMITAGVRVSEEEAFALFERERSKATVRSTNVRSSWFQKFAVNATDADAEAFAKTESEAVDAAFEATKANWKADCSLVSEILLEFSEGASEEERVTHGETARRLEELLATGADFSRLARAFGSGPAARHGGSIGCLDAEAYGAGGEELSKAIEGLSPGAISAIVETPRGLHLVRFDGKLAADQVAQQGRLEAARRLLADKLATDAARSFATALIEKTKAGMAMADALAELLPGQVLADSSGEAATAALVEAAKSATDAPEFEVGRPFSRGSTPLPGLKERDVAGRIFRLEKDDAMIEEPLETYSGFAFIQLKEKTIATREEFEADKEDLMKGLKEQKRSEVLTRYVARLRERANRIIVNPAFDPNTKSDESTSPDDANAG